MARLLLRALLAAVVGLLLLEGAASFLRFGALLAEGAPQLAERLHTRYDPKLGWVNAPNVRLPDLYGPGKGLFTNARGFRGRREYADVVPEDSLRLVCSGDSFTLGYGVADDETWCSRLATLVPGLETVNMGQGGYGIDPAYLWYRRDGRPLPHQLHVLAVIHEDFLRMESDRFLGYGKPVLELRDGHVVAKNVPVPRGSFDAPWLAKNAPLLAELRAFVVLQALALRVAPPAPRPRPNAALLPLSLVVFEELRDLNRARGSTFVLVYLPMREDLEPGPQDAWRNEIERSSRARDIAVIDLVESFRALSPADADGLFIRVGTMAYRAAEGHYTAEGNDRVAALLAERLADAGLLPAPADPL